MLHLGQQKLPSSLEHYANGLMTFSEAMRIFESLDQALGEVNNKLENNSAESPHFPNGFQSWRETHYLIVEFFTQCIKNEEAGIIKDTSETEGTPGLFSLAAEWTNEFEKIYEGQDWSELEYYETAEDFCTQKNKETTHS